MRKQEKIRKALGQTSLQYRNCIDAHFNMWCSKYAELFRLPLAALVADDHIQNWYHSQWLKSVELPFYLANIDLMDVKDAQAQEILQDIFLGYPEDIDGTWPQTLLTALRKRLQSKELETNVKRTNLTIEQ